MKEMFEKPITVQKKEFIENSFVFKVLKLWKRLKHIVKQTGEK